MKIRLLRNVLIAGEHVAAGTEIEANDSLCRQLVGLGRAVFVDIDEDGIDAVLCPDLETASVEPRAEAAISRKRAPRKRAQKSTGGK